MTRSTWERAEQIYRKLEAERLRLTQLQSPEWRAVVVRRIAALRGQLTRLHREAAASV